MTTARHDDDEAELSTLEEKLQALIADDAGAIERLQRRMLDDDVEEDEQ
jgi:hypothetical protein